MTWRGVVRLEPDGGDPVLLDWVTDFSLGDDEGNASITKDLTGARVVQIAEYDDDYPLKISIASTEETANIPALFALKNKICTMTYWDDGGHLDDEDLGTQHTVIVLRVEQKKKLPNGTSEIGIEVGVIS